MSGATPGPVINRLLGALPHAAKRRVLQSCEPVELVFGTVLSQPGERIRHVYFPINGFISLVAALEGHPSLEVGLIGDEGMLGVSLALGVDISPMRALVQGSGSALRMTAATFVDELKRNAELRRSLGRYTYVLLAQLSQTVACTCFHVLDARMARWLLMTHDRAHADQFYLTHALLSEMLGVRRSGVTRAAGRLQRKKIIRYTRGHIAVLDRKGLEQAACSCYAAVTEDYNRLLG